MNITVTSLHVYPVKSLRGISVEVGELTPMGLALDRAWLIIDQAGQFLSQRNLPAMARIGTKISEGCLVLERRGMGAVQVPLKQIEPGHRSVTHVWDDECEVIDEGDEVAHWLTQALKFDKAPRLVRMAPRFRRTLKHPERYGDRTSTHFADTAPYLIANLASLETLNLALKMHETEPVPMNRFRANIVVKGLPAFEEHRLGSLQGPGYRLGLRYPRERCVITTMDQQTGEKHPRGEPFSTLRRLNLMPDNPRGPAFGELSVLESGAGHVIRIGDRLTPEDRRDTT